MNNDAITYAPELANSEVSVYTHDRAAGYWTGSRDGHRLAVCVLSGRSVQRSFTPTGSYGERLSAPTSLRTYQVCYG